MKEPCNGLYASGALAKLRELHNAFAKFGNQCQFGSEARKEWERPYVRQGPLSCQRPKKTSGCLRSSE